MLVSAGSAQAERILGTKGPNKLAGTAKGDVIMGLSAAATESGAAAAGIASLERAGPTDSRSARQALTPLINQRLSARTRSTAGATVS